MSYRNHKSTHAFHRDTRLFEVIQIIVLILPSLMILMSDLFCYIRYIDGNLRFEINFTRFVIIITLWLIHQFNVANRDIWERPILQSFYK